MKFKSLSNNRIELFVRKTAECGFVCIKSEEGRHSFNVTSKYFQKISTDLKTDMEYQVEFENCIFGLGYVWNQENVLEQGVHYLFNDPDDEIIYRQNLLNSPLRQQYHFAPFMNWMNDPNGLCRFKNKFHMFYQYNPFEQKWNNMYWGHAVSDDLINWKHLPIFMEPQEKILEDPDALGGAFSGSALVTDDILQLFFTRDFESRTRHPSIIQSQNKAFCQDAITCYNEHEIIPAFSVPGVGYDFRDPKISKVDDKWYIVLAGKYSDVPSVLLFTSENLEDWTFLKPIVQFADPDCTGMECPDFFELDNQYIVTASAMHTRSKYGVRQPVYYFLGEWKNQNFKTFHSDVLDFGPNYYACQSFEFDGRRILFAWVNDIMQEHEERQFGNYGCLTLPRELHIENNTLYQAPAKEVYSLLSECIFKTEKVDVPYQTISGNCYYAKIGFNGNTDFSIVVAKDDESYLSVTRNNGMVSIKSDKNPDHEAQFKTSVKFVRKLELFMDREVLEVYVNDGEKVGTKIFVTNSTDGVFEATFEKPECAGNIEIFKMRSIHK